MQLRFGFLLALSLAMIGCGSSNQTAGAAGTLSGNWQMSLTNTGDTNPTTTQSGSLLQSGNAVTGTVLFVNPDCSGVASVTGTVIGSAFSLTEDPVGTSVSLSGTLTDPASPLSGNFTILSTGCTGNKPAPASGTFTASLVTPLNGTMSGPFASNNGSFSLTGQVSQGVNTGGSSIPLTGSLTFAGGFCYSGANIVGSISGTAVVMNLVDPDGVQIGQLTGTLSTDGTTLSPASLKYLGLGAGAAKGCVNDGGFNNLTLTITGS
jgi:hypothetical protein